MKHATLLHLFRVHANKIPTITGIKFMKHVKHYSESELKLLSLSLARRWFFLRLPGDWSVLLLSLDLSLAGFLSMLRLLFLLLSLDLDLLLLRSLDILLLLLLGGEGLLLSLLSRSRDLLLDLPFKLSSLLVFWAQAFKSEGRLPIFESFSVNLDFLSGSYR